jgi:hypothetical protein
MSDQPRKRRRAARKPKPAPPAEPPACDEAAEKAHIESLVATGQAAKRDAQGKLPAGATHEIVETEEGKPKVVRRRFSAY